MNKIIKRFINLRTFVLCLGLTAALFLMSTQEASAVEQKKIPYLIKVNRIYNTITIYEKDEAGNMKEPVKAMICSVGDKGTETIRGTFQTKEKYRWKALMGDVWGQYSTRIVGGILFHSVYYYENGNPASLASREFNKLGSAASHGCIRLTVEDAKWIYDNCAIGTTVVIYDDKKSPGPLGKPEPIKIPTSIRWDPTDPSNNNPYKDKMPQITGLKNISVAWGDKVDLLKGVKARSSLGFDITSKLSVNGNINSYIPGVYKINYSVIDDLGRIGTKSIKVSVEDSVEAPVFEGVSDKVVGNDVEVNEAYALADVEAYCEGIKLDKEDIEVNIEAISEVEYYITYTIRLGKTIPVTDYATIIIDNQAPVFTGIADRPLETSEIGEVPSIDYALSGVTVSDNYTEMKLTDIVVTISENPEGGYLITYEAVDGAGNVAMEQSIIRD
ncbi:MAG: hypothetical protein K0S01_3324 [Herbinix sp.]|jgi:hypothetical protein|nr:hypothetical protein [Herbinix sp.]